MEVYPLLHIREAISLWPVVAPRLRLADIFGPFHRRSEVTHHRLEPDVQALLLPAIQRHRDSPVDVAGDRPALQIVNHTPRKVDYSGSPVFLSVRQIFA